MPIYEYRCLECGFQDEYLQKVSEPQKTVCPSCGKESFRKLLSAAGFQLKGSGWYATDFRNSGAKPPKGGATGGKEKSESAAKPESESSSASTTEPKTETKKEATAA